MTAQAEARAMTFRDAVREGLRQALQRDPRVFLMGEDVGRYGGCFAVSRGLLAEFGPERIRDTPLSESGFVGAGIGAALGGMRPIVEVMTCNFSLLALDQIMNTAATLLHMSGGQFNVPIVIRMSTGGGKQLAAQHSHSLEGWYAHILGLTVARQRRAGHLDDGFGMLVTALDAPDPCADLREPDALQHGSDAGCRCRSRVETSRAVVRREGRDVSVLTYGASLARRSRPPPRSRPRASAPRSWTCACSVRSTILHDPGERGPHAPGTHRRGLE
ncbi:MAG: hypothetical protein R2708_10425 [Vicinamibacterales bacterium]